MDNALTPALPRTPRDIVAELRRSTRAARAAKPDPAPGMTRAQLAARVAELETRCARAAGLANNLARDLRAAAPNNTKRRTALLDMSDRAYAIRDIARGDKPVEVRS